MQTNEMLVSVIIPTYNRAHMLPHALRSVLSQTGVAFEVIVIDDASTDSTSEILQAFQIPHLRFERHAHRQGAAAARNTGIHASRGSWIAFLDSDDLWLPGLLHTQQTYFQKCSPKVGVVYSSFDRLHGNHRQRVPGQLRTLLSLLPINRYRLSGNLVQALPRGNFITLQSAMIRRSCFEEAGFFDESLPRLHDWEFWLRLAPHYDFHWVKQSLVQVQLTPESLSLEASTLPEAVQIIQEKYTSEYSDLEAHCNFILGDYHLQQGNHRLGRIHLQRAAHHSPASLLYWLAYLSAVLHPAFYRELSTRLGFRYTPK